MTSNQWPEVSTVEEFAISAHSSCALAECSSPAPDGWQRTTDLRSVSYTSVILFGALMVLFGLAIYKPVQLHWLTLLFGGYDGAHVVHLGVLCLLALFEATHLVLVALHPREIINMVTRGKDE